MAPTHRTLFVLLYNFIFFLEIIRQRIRQMTPAYDSKSNIGQTKKIFASGATGIDRTIFSSASVERPR
jgi:hypothetical protein